MPSATISRPITQQDAAEALKAQLGGGYQVTPHGYDSLTVKHGPLAFATVRLRWDGDATIFHPGERGGQVRGRLSHGGEEAVLVPEVVVDERRVDAGPGAHGA
jgi:hypothetical protein